MFLVRYFLCVGACMRARKYVYMCVRVTPDVKHFKKKWSKHCNDRTLAPLPHVSDFTDRTMTPCFTL